MVITSKSLASATRNKESLTNNTKKQLVFSFFNLSLKEPILNFLKSRKFEGWEPFDIHEDAVYSATSFLKNRNTLG